MNYRFQKVSSYIKHYGFKKLFRKAVERHSYKDSYNERRSEDIITNEEIDRQKNVKFSYNPVISILVPAFNTPHKAFFETLMSVKNQTYSNWELCVADAGEYSVKAVLDEVFGGDNRIKYVVLGDNRGIAANTNEALRLATGEYVAFLDHDDILEPDALFEIVTRISDKRAQMIYTDEDKVSENLDNYFRPYRKPDYNKMLLLSNNYICHFCVIDKAIVDKTGGFRSEYDGAQDYDLFLRCIEHTERVEHVPKVLYHWRVSTQSTSDNPFNKKYAYDAGKRAIEDYLLRNGFSDDFAVKETDDPGYFRIVYTGEITFKDKYELVISDSMKISDGWEKIMQGVILLTGADIVVPKIIKKNRYVYNGLAQNGAGYTQSLKGKPAWYRGKFNLGITAMEINKAPAKGILVKKSRMNNVIAVEKGYISNVEGVCNGIKMVYIPDVVINLKGKADE